MKQPLARAIQIVVFLFAAFGGFLKAAAPPVQINPRFAVGIGSFFVLIALFIISGIARDTQTRKLRKRWLRAGSTCAVFAIVTGVAYPWTLSRLTYFYPPPPDAPVAWRVKGWVLTQTAQDFIRQYPGKDSPGDLELNLPRGLIWTTDSVAKAEVILLVLYVGLVISISAAIFCLLEANLSNRKYGPSRN